MVDLRELIKKWRDDADSCPVPCNNEERGYSNAMYDAADELELALAAQPVPADRETGQLNQGPQGELACDDCGGRDFGVYNERTATLFCRDCGQFHTLKPVDAQPAPAGEVALPEPAYLTQLGNEGWSRAQLIAYGDARAAAASESVRNYLLSEGLIDEGDNDHVAAIKAVVEDRIRLAKWVAKLHENPRAAAAASRPAVPEGWVIERKYDDVIAITPGLPGHSMPRGITSDSDDPHEKILYYLADALLSAAPQPAAVKQDLTTSVADRLFESGLTEADLIGGES